MSGITDSLLNLVSGLGVAGRDKSTALSYQLVPLTQDQLLYAYRADWVAAKTVDIPAFDATRNWRTWYADQNVVEQIEAEEARLDLKRKVRRALVRARLLGGAALIIGDGAPDPRVPLDVTKIGRGGLKYVHVLGRDQLRAGERIRDIASPLFGEPELYYVASGTRGDVPIHHTRVVKFLGREVPDAVMVDPEGWADSVLQTVDTAVKAAGLAVEGIAGLIHEAKLDVIRIPQFTQNVVTQDYRDRLTTRFSTANVMKSTVNTLVLDKDEEWQRITVNWSGLPEIIRTYLMIASGAADIPTTRFLGQAPLGMNATGESDIRNYYDHVHADQSLELGPRLAPLDEAMLRSALGDRDPSVYYLWNPLWQMSDTERADVILKKAQAFKIDAESGLLDDEALRKGRESQLIDDGVYPALEQALEEQDELDEVPDQLEQLDRRMQDARPRTLYVRRNLLNWDEVRAWAEAQGFTELVNDPHVTIAFSRQPVDWLKAGEAWNQDEDGELVVRPGGPRVVEPLGDGGAVVLHFSSSELSWRHEAIKRDAGASWDFESYQPHVTLTYTGAPPNLDAIEPYRGALRFGPEIFEEISASAVGDR